MTLKFYENGKHSTTIDVNNRNKATYNSKCLSCQVMKTRIRYTERTQLVCRRANRQRRSLLNDYNQRATYRKILLSVYQDDYYNDYNNDCNDDDDDTDDDDDDGDDGNGDYIKIKSIMFISICLNSQ